ncbi:NAD-dependent epimerase/dehydratase family protein [Pontivivens ytuae]|uniref:NAD-dependent epimerase/dehydratase family protein n=1 Tax=Pontivivens ytuae TaxID=2789856 RepID=A0A7S9LN99_9RHOB|nr:NAD-dependent epimerase/dehydratase family protein [Pontivivens ytuae]QPH52219.1 NAD-dependent epimerase/dehydratase family protein [Pontivivens ytuae]
MTEKRSRPPKRLLLLGCGGFVGSHLVDRLLAETEDFVVGFDPCTTKVATHLQNPRFQMHAKYLQQGWDDGTLEKAIEEADVVINLAAICNPSDYNTRPRVVIQSNFTDVLPVLDRCAELGKWLIQYSTSEVYGRTLSSYVKGDQYKDPDLYVQEEEDTPMLMGPIQNQRWSYATAKQLLERYTYALHDEFDMPYTIIRPYNFFGPRMDYIPGRDGEGVPRVLACFMAALLDGKPLELVDGGEALRVITSIHDAIDSVMLMLDKPEGAKNQIFNIGNSGNELHIYELAEKMRKVYAEVSGDDRFLEHPINTVTAEAFYGPGYEDCDRRVPDISRAWRQLGWAPSRSIDEILRETVSYYYNLYGPGGSATNRYETSYAVAGE